MDVLIKMTLPMSLSLLFTYSKLFTQSKVQLLRPLYLLKELIYNMIFLSLQFKYADGTEEIKYRHFEIPNRSCI